MAAAVTKKSASPHHLTYLVVGDGTVANTVPSATILADMVDGPLKDAWQASYANQAAMQDALLAGGSFCRALLSPRTQVADTTAQINQPSVNVDTAAVTATRAELNIQTSDTTGQEFYVHLEHLHSIIR
jgi:hypothetical protein